MANWRHIALIVAAVIICGCVLLFQKQQRRSPEQPGPLSAGLQKLIGDWTLNRIPSGKRFVTLVIADGSAGGDVLGIPPASADFAKPGSWFSRLFGRRGKLENVGTPTPLNKAFAGEPNAIVWTHDGFSTATEEQVTREITRAIVLAHDAGAELNIVAQGLAAAPVLKSLKSLEDVERSGVKVGANKVVFVGTNESRLGRIPWIPSYSFGKPGNVIEMANVWTEDTGSRGDTMLRLMGERSKDVTMALSEAYPRLGASGTAVDPVMGIVKTWTMGPAPIEPEMATSARTRKEAGAGRAAAKAAKPAGRVMRSVIDGRMRPKMGVYGAGSASAQERGSLGMIRSGGEYRGAGGTGAKEEWYQDSREGNWEEEARKSAQCCSELGGSWRKGSFKGLGWHDGFEGDRREYFGCCAGADWPPDVRAMPSCSSVRYGRWYHMRDCAFSCSGK